MTETRKERDDVDVMDDGVQLIFLTDRSLGGSPVVGSGSAGDGITGRSGQGSPAPCSRWFPTTLRPSVNGVEEPAGGKEASMATAIQDLLKESKEVYSAWRNSDRVTHCDRCGGFMVTEQLIDQPAHRCVQCGEIIDAVILQNRRRGLSVGMN